MSVRPLESTSGARRRVRLADALSLSRLVFAPVLPVVALAGMTRTLIGLIVWGLVSDAIDGTVARLTGSTGERGARLDSICDVVFYAMAILGFVIAVPVARTELLATFAVTAVALVVPSVIGWLKFGAMPSYHTVLSRLVLAAFGLGLLVFVTTGVTWPFRLGAILALASAVDDVLITLLLPEPRPHVPHVVALLRRTGTVEAFAETRGMERSQ